MSQETNTTTLVIWFDDGTNAVYQMNPKGSLSWNNIENAKITSIEVISGEVLDVGH
jgi:hypothetical protein